MEELLKQLRVQAEEDIEIFIEHGVKSEFLERAMNRLNLTDKDVKDMK